MTEHGYVKSYMLDRRSDDGSVETVSIEVVNGQWPKGTFTRRQRRAVFLDEQNTSGGGLSDLNSTE